jgi:hypothetical protein
MTDITLQSLFDLCESIFHIKVPKKLNAQSITHSTTDKNVEIVKTNVMIGVQTLTHPYMYDFTITLFGKANKRAYSLLVKSSVCNDF